ncbi:MAG: glycosyltransferase family 2 protein [Deltaproteobacteria bacterium]|nr:glycosyltransferase family 2 protein [Deltaproteobacteria bacterium]MCB9479651.1 glycosyltransferase family 2 protein [Deltaproteobacteria bacterium]MCB9489852.1 glycosyltransferase family 2 protein [Deltaproteobacteria bacterium]
MDLSIVIPCFNERESLPELFRQLTAVLERTKRSYEILMVDDGSSDGTWDYVAEAHEDDERIRGIRFRRNFGKSAALTAGFAEARGDVVITLDADLQDDPDEIPRFLELIDEGVDMVTGWKQNRQDPLEKTLPSRLFNRVTSRLTGLDLHDFNCGFKGYRRAVIDEIRVQGDMHRFIPVLAHQQGFAIAELPVKHNPRRHGKSKYGFERYLRGATDLVTIIFLTKYAQRPGHLFGGGGLLLGGAGFAICLYMAILWFLGFRPIGNRPLLLLGILLLIMGVQFVSIGLIGEMLSRLTTTTDTSHAFSIRERLD